MKRTGWGIPILFFFISIIGLLFYQKDRDIQSFAGTTTLPPVLWSETPVNINKILLSENGSVIEATKLSETWMLSSPTLAKADPLFIYSIIQVFKHPLFIETIDTDPIHLKEYGIDEFSPIIKLYTKDNYEYELVRGELADASHYYVYAPMSDTIYTMPISSFDNIHTEFNLWRDKNLVTLDKTAIEKIDFTYEGSTYTLFPIQAPSSVSFQEDRLDERVLNNLIDFLITCKVTDFITDAADSNLFNSYGFNAPVLEIKIFLKSGEPQTITIGNMIKEQNLCYAAINHSNSIFSISYLDLSMLKLALPEESDLILPDAAQLIE